MPFTKTEVSQYYVAVFNRASEGEGNEYWQGNSGTASELVNEMLATSAAQDYFGASLDTDQAFIEHIYLNTLSKTVTDDPTGIAFWVQKLTDGEDRGSVVEQLVFAALQPENAGDAQDQFNNRVAVSDYAADTLTTPPADFATSMAFDGTLVVTSDAATVVSAQAAVSALANDGGNGGDGEGTEGDTLLLTTSQDDLTGTAGNDTFKGYVFDNSNTLQSGDMIDGGAGNDDLEVQIGNSQSFAISALTTGVENVFVNARSDSSDTNDNNLENNFVQIDAADMRDVQEWWTDGSRADVVIEDIRIGDAEITSDILFGMRDTDPGSSANGGTVENTNDSAEGASLHAYFDANSLRSTNTSDGAVLNLSIIDLESDTSPGAVTDNLVNDPANGFKFTLGATTYTVQKQEFRDATTYTELTALINAELAAQGLSGTVTAKEGATFTKFDDTGVAHIGTVITLTNSGDESFDVTGTNGGWLYDGEAPADANTSYKMDTAAPVTTDKLITSQVIVDNVGRGSEGGDLEIGTMSTRGGVEQFDVLVEDSSWLNSMYSTNEALEVVDIKTSTEDRDAVGQTGNVSTGALVIGAGFQNGADNLDDLRTEGTHVQTNGLVDVRTLAASTFAGDLTVGASITEASFAKYLHPIEGDVLGAETTDDLLFDYKSGSGNDKINVEVAADLLADSDFSFNIGTGNGNDMVQTDIDVDLADTSATWYTSHAANRNMSIDTGAGDDTVATLGEGNVTITTGAGNDTVYADNTGTGIGATAGTAAIAEVFVVTYDADAAGGTTLVFDTVTTTTGVGAQTDAQVAASVVAAGNTPNWSVAAGANANEVVFTAAVAGDVTDVTDVVGGGTYAGVETYSVTTQGANLVAPTVAISAPVVTTDIAGLDGTKAVWTANNLAADNQIDTLDLAATRSFTGIKGQVQVEFSGGVTANDGSGVNSAWIDIAYDSAANTTSAYQVRQAIKDAVNNDAVLSKLLVVKDGPSDTFVVQSLIDGTMVATDLDINFRAPQTSATVMTTYTDGQLQLTGAEEASALALFGSPSALFNAAGADTAYGVAFAQDDLANNLSGADSLSLSNNIITGGQGDDVLVLGTTYINDADATNDSIDTVVFSGSFGTDTIVNFTVDADDGSDLLDFTSYMNKTDANTDGVVDTAISLLGGTALTATNQILVTSAAATLNGAPTITAGAADSVANTGLVLAIHADAVADDAYYADAHVADVYTAIETDDGTTATVALTLVGTIDLTDVNISTLTLADFVAV